MDTKKLKAEFDRTLEVLAKPVVAFPWERLDAYSFWLAQSYYLVRHTTTLIALTASKYGTRDLAHHRIALRHLRDELGHDELVLQDLKALGLKPEKFPELIETSVIYQTQYYWIERCSPVALGGYSVLLEGLAATVGQQIYDKVEKAHGKKVGNFLRVHAEADVGHYGEGVEAMSGATDEELRFAMRNLEQGGMLYRGMLDAIVRQVGAAVKPMKKAA